MLTTTERERARVSRRTLLLVSAVLLVSGLVEWLSGLGRVEQVPAYVLLVVTPAVVGLLLEHVEARDALRLRMLMMALVTGACVYSTALRGGSQDRGFLMLGTLPLLTFVLAPEIIQQTIVSAVVVLTGGLLVMGVEGRPLNEMAHWAMQAGGMGLLAVAASARYRRVRKLLDQEIDSGTHKLTAGLSLAASRLLVLRTEEELLAGAVQALREEGLTARVYRKEGSTARVSGPGETAEAGVGARGNRSGGTATEAGASARGNRPGGTATEAGASARGSGPGATATEASARGDGHGEQPLGTGAGEHIEQPILVEGAPYGVLRIDAQLSPARVAALELFAVHVGAALENVRLQGGLVTQERLAALGEASAVLAHEVRNPLGAILNGVSLLRRGGEGDPGREQLLTIVEEEAARLDHLVRDLLHFARPLEPRVTSVDLNELTRGLLRALRERDVFRNVTLRFESGGAAMVAGDSSYLLMALENLLRNAAQASPAGGEVTIALEQAAGGFLLVSVDDQGGGIPEEHRSRIFDPFFTTRVTGTGLGLAIVKRVAHAHGGKVQVGTSRTGGARFELTLPGLKGPE